MLTDHPSVVARLNEDLLGWLTTVDEAGQPQASPIWFVIDGDDLLVHNRVDARRLTNLELSPKIAFNLRGDPQGDSIVTLEGTASIDPDVSTPLGSTDYMTKYGDEIVRLGWTHEEYDEEFPVAIRIMVTRVRAPGNP